MAYNKKMLIEDITEFLPKYPNINNYNAKYDFLNTYDENFNLATFKKKEFNENILQPYEDFPKKGELLKAQETISRFFSSRTPYDRLLLLWEMGSGKCHKIDTPIIMSDGQIKMVQDIQVGEMLMGDDSTPRLVTSLARGEDEMYEIIPLNGGDNYVVNQEHILCLKVPTYPSMYFKDNAYIIEWIQDNKFMSKKYILNYDNVLDKIQKERDAIEFKLKIKSEQILEIEVKDYLNLPKEKQNLLKAYRVPIDFKKQKVDVHSYYFGYNLLSTDEKYNFESIPNNYKFNSINNRMNLLAGLIDSNGVFKNNSFEISYLLNKQKIFDDIIYIARSLGFTSYKKGESNIVIKGKNLLKIPIKSLFRNLESYKDTEDNLLSSIKIKHVGRDNYYGFTLDGNRRYLLGDFSVTHNTCAAVGAIEQIRKEKSSFKEAIILARNPQLLKNFQNELVNKCTSGQYIPENFDYLTEKTKSTRINKLVKEFYNFDFTFHRMAKKVQNMSDQAIINNFSNRIIVIDEVHNIKLKEKGDDPRVDIYKQLHRMLHLVQNCKILLMSGTPIKDSIIDFPDIVNLIVPLNKQLPVKQSFINTYFNFEKEVPKLQRNYTIKDEKIDELKDLLKGKVSYLKSISYEIKKNFIGEKNISNLNYFIVDEKLMSKFQSEVCIGIFTNNKKDEEEDDKDEEISSEKSDAYYSASREASLFVFPDGTYGKQGFEYFITKSKSTLTGDKKTIYSLKKELIDLIIEKDDDENYTQSLKNLSEFSSKYAETIKNILRASKEGKSSFVYCSIVNGSGSILFSLILKLFGFSPATTSTNLDDKKNRYTLFTSDIVDNSIKKIMDKFNEPRNLHGEYINVIIGSRLVSEGYSFKNIQEVHILTPHFNYSETAQAIARGYRFGSHNDLIHEQIVNLAIENDIEVENYIDKQASGYRKLSQEINKKLNRPIDFPLDIINPVFTIYQYVAVPIQIENRKKIPLYKYSIDLLMYKRSEIKDVNIKRIERLIKESAFDCALNYKRNIRDNDYQAECDYMECEYNCDDIPSEYYKNENGEDFYDKDYSTFQLYYNQDNKNKIKEIINSTFRIYFQIELKELLIILKDYTQFEVLDVLSELISNNTIIYDKYNLPRYLRENNNVYFLVDNMIVEGNYLLSYYTKNPILISNISFEAILDFYFQKQIPSIIETISTTNDYDKFKDLLNMLPKNIVTMIVENSIIAKINNKETKFRDKIIEFYKYNINDLSENVGSLLYIHYMDDELRCLKDVEKGWENCNNDDIKLYNSSKKEKRKTIAKAATNPYGYYGKISSSGEFCIAEVDEEAEREYKRTNDARKLKTGSVCGTGKKWTSSGLLKLVIVNLKIPIPEVKQGFKDMTKDIQKKFVDKKKIIETNKTINEVFDTDEKKKQLEIMDENDANRIIFWMNQTKVKLCDSIKKFFEEKGLLYPDENCGTPRKRNKVAYIYEEGEGAEETKG